MSVKTRIYVDVDGVINAFSSRIKNPWPVNYEKTFAYGYTIIFNPAVIGYLNYLSDREDVETVWLTTWQDTANTDLGPAVGISKPWRVLTNDDAAPVGYQGFLNYDYWWKLKAISDDLDDNPVEKFVWIDDELSRRGRAVEWYNSTHADAATGLLVSTEDTTGLTPADIRGIIDYINAG